MIDPFVAIFMFINIAMWLVTMGLFLLQFKINRNNMAMNDLISKMLKLQQEANREAVGIIKDMAAEIEKLKKRPIA